MKKIPFSITYLPFLIFTAGIILLSVWGPEMLAGYRDREILDGIHAQTTDLAGEGYRYALSSSEKLYIMSEALSSQKLNETAAGVTGDYQEVPGTYAFIVNHRGPYEREITDEEIYGILNRQVKLLAELEIVPAALDEVGEDTSDAVLYSAIDVLEPRNNVAVWKVSLSDIQGITDKHNKLIDVYIDADDGRIYEFYARTDLTWEELNPDDMILKWSEYMGLEPPVPSEAVNPLMEATPCFRKYEFAGTGQDHTVVTIGFYEGINELFLKVSR